MAIRDVLQTVSVVEVDGCGGVGGGALGLSVFTLKVGGDVRGYPMQNPVVY